MKNNILIKLNKNLPVKIKTNKNQTQHIQEKLKVNSICFWLKINKNKINLDKNKIEENSFRIKLEIFQSILIQIRKNRKKFKSINLTINKNIDF
jgi:hypothetical protein